MLSLPFTTVKVGAWGVKHCPELCFTSIIGPKPPEHMCLTPRSALFSCVISPSVSPSINSLNWVWRFRPIIPELWWIRQEDNEFNYTVNSCYYIVGHSELESKTLYQKTNTHARIHTTHMHTTHTDLPAHHTHIHHTSHTPTYTK